MTEAIEQEALAIFAAELAKFLEEAIARLDALGTRQAVTAETPPEPEKPARKPRKRKSTRREDEPHPNPAPLPVEAVGEAADLPHLVDPVGDPVDGQAVLRGQAPDQPPGYLPLQFDHREQAA